MLDAGEPRDLIHTCESFQPRDAFRAGDPVRGLQPNPERNLVQFQTPVGGKSQPPREPLILWQKFWALLNRTGIIPT